MKKYRTLREIQSDIQEGQISCVELVTHYLQRIEASRHLNAFIQVYEDEALAAAQVVDTKISQGTAGKLAGLVLGLKDLLCHKDHELTASSNILQGFKSLFTGTAVQRLLDEDAIVIGRQSCDEFAMGSSNENSSYGPCLNPINNQYVPGGSSGASATAVKAGLCHASIASDTGGSIRQPASFCDLVGLKPTYGRVSRYGLISYASSFDQIGPITHSVEDAARILEIIAGPDGKDNTLSQKPLSPYFQASIDPITDSSLRIGIIKPIWDAPGLDPEIKKGLEDSVRQLKDLGHSIIEYPFSFMDYVVPCYYILTPAEASSNLSRYDGVRYGYRTENANDLEDLYKKSRTEGFGTEVKRRIVLGTFVLSAGYYDAYYTQAMKVRRLIQQETLAMLNDCEVIFMPTCPSTAFKLGEKTEDPVEMYLSDIFTVHSNLAGIPSLSLPLGKHSNGLPYGYQIMGRPFDEARLLQIGQHIMDNVKLY